MNTDNREPSRQSPATNRRIVREKKTVEIMIHLYCHRKEGNAQLCDTCREMLEYADDRLVRCRFGEHKPTCKRCPVHCYRPDMRERIRKVMRWSGPRMMLFHPLITIRHLITGFSRLEKRQMSNN